MKPSQIEFYSRGRNGKIDINWRGNTNGGERVFNQASNSLKQIDNLLIVAKSEPNTAATCFRLIYNIVKKAKLYGVETRVVLTEKSLLEAAELTGFTNFFQVFLSELDALDDLGIAEFYPLLLTTTDNTEPDPVAS